MSPRGAREPTASEPSPVTPPGRADRDFGLLDAYDQVPPAPEPAPVPSMRTWVGLGALTALCAALSLSFERLATSEPVSSGPILDDAPPGSRSLDSLSVAASLASAAGALAEIESLRRSASGLGGAALSSPSAEPRAASPATGAFPGEPLSPIPSPPLPESFPSPTDCMNTYLPEVQVLDRSLDVVCEERDLWSIEWKIHPRIAFRGTEGANMWAALGPYTLAAIATLRAGCCKDPEPLQAAVPVLTCGILRDELRQFGPVPEREPFEAYESTMNCLAARNVRLPARWTKASKRESEAAFRRFVEVARQRGR